MCLFTHQKEYAVAKRPIKCVKIMRRFKSMDGTAHLHNLFSFVAYTTYRPKVVTQMFIEDCDEREKLFDNPDNEIYNREFQMGGILYNELSAVLKRGRVSKLDKLEEKDEKRFRYKVIHRGICSFLSMKDAQNTFEWAVRRFAGAECEVCMVECKIPKGARYWKGVSNCTGYEHGYASDQIMPVKELMSVDCSKPECVSKFLLNQKK